MTSVLRRLLEEATPSPWLHSLVAERIEDNADAALIVWLVNRAELLADVVDAANEYVTLIGAAAPSGEQDDAHTALVAALSRLEQKGTV